MLNSLPMMEWINEYQLFLFDLDGLLVNTEEIHYRSYKEMCANRGFDLDWSFAEYCQIAHYRAEGLKEGIYTKFPELQLQEPDWDILYAEKKAALVRLFQEGAIHLMDGAEELLIALDKANISRCVVTHSADVLVEILRKKIPLLNTIPVWLTREDYSNPKPHPECYEKAIARLVKEEDRVIGFEDTPRGLKALLQTRAVPVLITSVPYPEIPDFVQQGALHYPSLSSIC